MYFSLGTLAHGVVAVYLAGRSLEHSQLEIAAGSKDMSLPNRSSRHWSLLKEENGVFVAIIMANAHAREDVR